MLLANENSLGAENTIETEALSTQTWVFSKSTCFYVLLLFGLFGGSGDRKQRFFKTLSTVCLYGQVLPHNVSLHTFFSLKIVQHG